MTLVWEDLRILETDFESTPCDCCGKNTVQINGDIEDAKGQWIAFYWVRYAEGHPELDPVFRFGTGNWSEEATAEQRWCFGLAYNKDSGGARLLDLSSERGDVKAIYLDRDDILGSSFAAEAFAMWDAVFMKDSRLDDLRK